MQFLASVCQETEQTNITTEQQLEGLAESDDAETEDDSYLQQLEYFKIHPLNLNKAGTDELAELNMLTALQIKSFLDYRRLLGKLVNIYELQAIPAWDIVVIRKLLPFIAVKDDNSIAEKLANRWRHGSEVFLLRYARTMEKSKGYAVSGAGNNYYLGSPDKLFFRYRYNFKNLLQWGILGDKDAGEQFFKGHQKQGFDFYSFHFFARQLGIVKAIALGDFTANLGQGLIQWQSLAFRKSAELLSVKRQAAVLRPYNSSGEFNFHRGAGITLQKGKWETTLFSSVRSISANIVVDSITGETVSAFQASGYHRTASEINDKNSILQIAYGGNIKYQFSKAHIGLNAIHYQFSKQIQKIPDLYNLFNFQGSALTNASVDYSFTYRNVHLFGEAATDHHFNKALLSAAIISLDPKVDASLLYRKIAADYWSINANAFTENSLPINETGLYTGISIRPSKSLQIQAYVDIFRFPWLKYRVDAPSSGEDFFTQLIYTPDKQVEVYVRYKSETKQLNLSNTNLVTKIVNQIPKNNLRFQTSFMVSRKIALKHRVELLWYNKGKPDAEEGFLTFLDGSFKPPLSNWAGSMRLQYFESNGFNSRLYAYENDLPFSFSIPFFYDKGLRYYFNLNWNASQYFKKQGHKLTVNVWLKWSQSIYADKTTIGSGLEEIAGNKKSDFKFQVFMSR